ncbi:MAG: 4Fe-4S binding protein [Candidatus Latescibacteria bacterium]|nr:4Fe-4S binding protein [Candidatus Latescibacterota bacterium]
MSLNILLFKPSFVLSQVVERFPKPDFQSDYTRPLLQTPEPRIKLYEYFDLFVLITALSLASYFALKLRSRTKMFLLMIFCLLYFGFFRKGCICPVGSVQNVSLALFDAAYTIPATVIAFFALPLVFTLFFGRTFCAAVCPLGAIQDVVIFKPAVVSPWIAQVLGMIPYLYLGLAVLFASTGAGFIICQYDPFVGFFRFGASFNMIALGISLLILGTVVARPYCRFLCPYGVILNWMSRLSKWHVTITPAECINCRLCEESCPFGAINMPVMEHPVNRGKSIRFLAVLFILLPVVVMGNGWVFSRLSVPLSGQHFTVSLAAKIQSENSGITTGTTEETDAFRASGKTVEELFREASVIRQKFRTGGWIFGGFLGLIICLKLINLTVIRRHDDYTADSGTCFSCARCFSYCPIEQVRLGNMDPDEASKIKKSR